MFHCKKFNSIDVWFLDNIDQFERRELRLGICPECKKLVGELIEVRKSDGKKFCDRYTGEKLERVKEREQCRTIYTAQEVNRNNYKKKLSGGSMGLIQQSKKALRFF